MNRTTGIRVTGPFRPASMKERPRELGWPPPSKYRHVAGLPKPEPRPALTIREAMGTVPIARPTGLQ
jgi:hypothetical protein